MLSALPIRLPTFSTVCAPSNVSHCTLYRYVQYCRWSSLHGQLCSTLQTSTVLYSYQNARGFHQFFSLLWRDLWMTYSTVQYCTPTLSVSSCQFVDKGTHAIGHRQESGASRFGSSVRVNYTAFFFFQKSLFISHWFILSDLVPDLKHFRYRSTKT